MKHIVFGQSLRWVIEPAVARELFLDTIAVRYNTPHCNLFQEESCHGFLLRETARTNPPGVTENDVTIGVMEAIAQRQWKKPF